MNIYARLTHAEQQYLAQDNVYAADINVVEELWTIVDYLTPLYGRMTPAWYDMVRRITLPVPEDETLVGWETPEYPAERKYKIKV